MAAPEMASVPSGDIRKDMLPEEWEACLDAWLALAEYYLGLPEDQFSPWLESLSPFLVSYTQAVSSISENDAAVLRLRSHLVLKQKTFLLSHRTLSRNQIPKPLLQWTFLADLCQSFGHFRSLQELLVSVWRRNSAVIETTLDSLKRSTTSSRQEDLAIGLRRIAPLLQALPEAGESLMTGSDFLDEVIAAYPHVALQSRPSFIVATYLGLVALLREHQPNTSLFFDQLYALKADADKLGTSSLISAVVSSTPLLSNIRASKSLSDQKRVQDLAKSLGSLRGSPVGRPRKRAKQSKGKERAIDESAHGFDKAHVHRMSLISQIQDLFPDLGTGFVAKLLSEFNDDVEQATSHLLEGTLPQSLSNADRTEDLPVPAIADPVAQLSPAPTPHLERRNIFDDDELDQLAVDSSRLHIGKKDADVITEAQNKAAILSALAAFDSDDDERDDTYDVEDVGGTVDSAVAEADQVDIEDKNEEALFRAFRLSPKVFDRDGVTRRSKARMALRSETGLTDEAIEGWLIVTGRDPRKMKRLEAKYSTFAGQQTELPSTSWKNSPVGSGAEDSGEDSISAGERGRGGSRGSRGRGGHRGGFRGRGGNVAGPPEDRNTQQARQRKEANKGSRANHNRRDQRAKKLARGGYGI